MYMLCIHGMQVFTKCLMGKLIIRREFSKLTVSLVTHPNTLFGTCHFALKGPSRPEARHQQ